MPRSAATQTRLELLGSTSTALIGRVGRPDEKSVQWLPPSSVRKTRPPPMVENVTQIRLRFAGSTKNPLIQALALGRVSSLAADHAVPVQLMRNSRPTLVPTQRLSGL